MPSTVIVPEPAVIVRCGEMAGEELSRRLVAEIKRVFADAGAIYAEFTAEATNSSRVHPAGGRRKPPLTPANPRKPPSENACSRSKSPRTAAQPGSTKTGLSRRRSRVRVPSLP
jgi:hypothetical protein